jgi:hypothetical protein
MLADNSTAEGYLRASTKAKAKALAGSAGQKEIWTGTAIMDGDRLKYDFGDGRTGSYNLPEAGPSAPPPPPPAREPSQTISDRLAQMDIGDDESPSPVTGKRVSREWSSSPVEPNKRLREGDY